MLDQNDDATILQLGQGLGAYRAAQLQAWASDQDDPEGERQLADQGSRLLEAIAGTAAATGAGRAVKLQALTMLNGWGGLTWADRIAEAGSHAEALAWSLVSDLATHPRDAHPSLPPVQAQVQGCPPRRGRFRPASRLPPASRRAAAFPAPAP